MIRPTRGKILGEVIDKETQTKSGLYLAENNKKVIPDRVEVLATGIPEIDRKGKEIKFHVSTGNVVFIKKYAGSQFKFKGRDFVILKNKDIISKA